MVPCTPTKKACIYNWRNEGWTFAAIGQRLGLHYATVSRNYAQMRRTKNPYYKTPLPGCPRHLGPCNLRRAENLSQLCMEATTLLRKTSFSSNSIPPTKPSKLCSLPKPDPLSKSSVPFSHHPLTLALPISWHLPNLIPAKPL